MSTSLDPFQLRGRWLRQRRAELNLNLQQVSKAVGISTYLSPIETYDLYIPPAWGKVLMRLGITPVDTWEVADTGLTGSSVREWRTAAFVGMANLAQALRVHEVALMLVEGRDWPVPPEWFPLLEELGVFNPPPKSKRSRPAWGTQDKAVERVRGGEPEEAVAKDVNVMVEVLRAWVRIADAQVPSKPAPAEKGEAEDQARAESEAGEAEDQASAESEAAAGEGAEVPEEADPDASLRLSIPVTRSQLRALSLLARLFPERSPSDLAGHVVAQFIREQHAVVAGIEKVVGLVGGGDGSGQGGGA